MVAISQFSQEEYAKLVHKSYETNGQQLDKTVTVALGVITDNDTFYNRGN